MQVRFVEGPITWSKVFASPGTLMQLERVKVVCGRPDAFMLAAFCTDDPKPRAAAIVYHAGRRGWALEEESFGQKSNALTTDRLDVLMHQLGTLAGVLMLPITLSDNVDGQYVVFPKARTSQAAA
jgi:hypothetical protein